MGFVQAELLLGRVGPLDAEQPLNVAKLLVHLPIIAPRGCGVLIVRRRLVSRSPVGCSAGQTVGVGFAEYLRAARTSESTPAGRYDTGHFLSALDTPHGVLTIGR